VFAYFTAESGLSAHSDQLADLVDLAADSGADDTVGGEEQVTARLDAATKVAEGQEAELWLDLRPLHVFDPQTGRNLALEVRAAGGTGAAGTTGITGAGGATGTAGTA
jgi:multiple sugar transport system ATP-binding protein